MFHQNSSELYDVFSACQNGNLLSFIEVFKKEHANKKFQGMTLLHMALHFGYMQIVDVLLSAGADPAIREDQDGRSVLFEYIYSQEEQRDLRVVEKLIAANKAVLNVCNNSGFSPLHIGVTYKDIELSTYLLEQGADPNIRVMGKSPAPIITAIQNNDSAHLELLLRYKADYTIETSTGYDPLGCIVKNMVTISLTMDPREAITSPKLKPLKDMGWLIVQQHHKDGRPLRDDSLQDIFKPQESIDNIEKDKRKGNLSSTITTNPIVVTQDLDQNIAPTDSPVAKTSELSRIDGRPNNSTIGASKFGFHPSNTKQDTTNQPSNSSWCFCC